MTVHTGGCQCGAVRFRVEGDPDHSSICHCRMCQKAFGAYYAPLVSVREVGFTWTRGEPKRFQSSDVVQRGFCAECGTPLTYEAPDGMSIAAGAFDDPSAFPPAMQWGVERKVGFVDHLHTLPAMATEDDLTSVDYLVDLTSHQHPDHDTQSWPEEK